MHVHHRQHINEVRVQQVVHGVRKAPQENAPNLTVHDRTCLWKALQQGDGVIDRGFKLCAQTQTLGFIPGERFNNVLRGLGTETNSGLQPRSRSRR